MRPFLRSYGVISTMTLSPASARIVLAHAAGGVRDDLVFVLELDAECGVRKELRNHAGELQKLFLWHSRPAWIIESGRPRPRISRNYLAESPALNNRPIVASGAAPLP